MGFQVYFPLFFGLIIPTSLPTSNKWGLKVNVDKTKVLIVTKHKSFKFGAREIEVVTFPLNPIFKSRNMDYTIIIFEISGFQSYTAFLLSISSF